MLTYDQTLWEALYDVGDPADRTRRIHYTRQLYDLNRQWIARRLAAVPQQWIDGASVVVVGCGFGWLIEQLLDVGVDTAVGVDPSPYVHANLSDESRGDVTVVDATVGVDDVRRALRDAGLPQQFDVVIDEDAASSHDDAEIGAFLDGCEDLLRGNQTGRVVHLVTPQRTGGGDSAINWKPMADWAALRPGHTWVDITTGQAV